jgi:hypothetical protein
MWGERELNEVSDFSGKFMQDQHMDIQSGGRGEDKVI